MGFNASTISISLASTLNKNEQMYKKIKILSTEICKESFRGQSMVKEELILLTIGRY